MHDLPIKKLKKLIKEPIFIISAPRAGSTLLFSLLQKNAGFWSIGDESHSIFAQFPHLIAENNDFDSGRLLAHHADNATAEEFIRLFFSKLKNSSGASIDDVFDKSDIKPIKLLEKTPRNALNIPFLLKVFPDARFIFLHREPFGNISSIIEAWELGLKTPRFVTYPNLPGWKLQKWCLLLPPNWRQYQDSSLAEIAAFQWRECNNIALDDLQKLPKNRWVSVSYTKLLENPQKQIDRLCRFAQLPLDQSLVEILQGDLPLSKTVVTKPEKEKWRRHENELRALEEEFQSVIIRLNSLVR